MVNQTKAIKMKPILDGILSFYEEEYKEATEMINAFDSKSKSYHQSDYAYWNFKKDFYKSELLQEAKSELESRFKENRLIIEQSNLPSDDVKLIQLNNEEINSYLSKIDKTLNHIS